VRSAPGKMCFMTIRQYIERRIRNLALIFALPYAALQCMRVAIRFWPAILGAQPTKFVLLFTEPRFAAIFVAWFGSRVLTIPCPRCSRPLGAAVAVVWGSKKTTRCPNCRVSLDEPREVSVDPK
jgi:hypothetical protein